MEYTLYQLAWLFLFYSLGGWCVLTLFSLITRRELTNTGFLNLPLCPIYGLEAVTYTVFLKELAGRPVWLFIGGMILFMLGLVGEYVGRMYMTMNKSPQYVIRSTTAAPGQSETK